MCDEKVVLVECAFGLQIMLPLSHLCGELVEHRSMCEAHKRLADDLAAGGCHVSQPKKKARKGGGGGAGSGGGGAGSYHYQGEYDDFFSETGGF